MNRRLRGLTAPACLALLLAPPLQAEDHILTIGGGYSPAGNQVSLERNMIFFRKLLSERLLEETRHDLYFADGSSTNPDLQFQLEEDEIPKGNKFNTKIYMWNRKSMEAAKLSSLIDGLPKGVSVMTVMVYAYGSTR